MSEPMSDWRLGQIRGTEWKRAEKAEAALTRVTSLHRERPWHWSDGGPRATQCQDCNVNWPCDTIRAIAGDQEAR